MDVSGLPTPALVISLSKVKNNVNNMIERCKKYGVKLRPHFKTIKTVEGAILQTGGSRRGLVVSTIPEADLLADNGFDDILYAVPLAEDPTKIKRCIDLNKKLEAFHVMIDRVDMIETLSKAAESSGTKWSVFINVDTGYHRAGILCDSDAAIELARRLHECEHIDFQGLYTHCGHSYMADENTSVRDVADDVIKALLDLVNRLKAIGVECVHYGLGSTPTCSQPTEMMRKVTEWHPGNYILYDIQQEMLGSCTRDEIACKVLTRVIGHYGGEGRNHILVDCGWTAFTTQGFGKVESGGYGAIADHPELKLASMTQEIGKITTVDGSNMPFDKYPVGSMLSILPYHSCATCCMHAVYYVADDDGKIVDKWHPVKGW